MIYALIRRLLLGKTTIYCDKPEHAHIFDGEGVRKMSLSDGFRFPELDTDIQSCALVNLGDRQMSVPDTFYPEFRVGRVVVATSPNIEHWRSFAHEPPAEVYCMPTWGWPDIYFGR